MTVWGFCEGGRDCAVPGSHLCSNRLGECRHDHLPRLRGHWALGAEQGLISHVLLVVAKHLPLVFECFGSWEHSSLRCRSNRVCTARWASAKEHRIDAGKDRAVLSSDAIRRRRLCCAMTVHRI